MNRMICTLIVFAMSTLGTLPAQAYERGAVAPDPPVEPSNLFSVPTSRVVRSMDLDLSGTGVVMSQSNTRPQVGAVLGLGDIAQLEIGTISIVSGIRKANALTDVHSAGLKVYLPLAGYARGIAASFRRSGTYRQETPEGRFDAKVGEFFVVTTLANYPDEALAANPRAGWRGVKIKGHGGMKYVDGRLDGAGTAANAFWRPAGGVELWKNDARARVLAEVNWIPSFEHVGGDRIDIVRVVTGGVRYFFSKHTTFDIGVRHQSNYDGLAESAIQARLNLSMPTHKLRDRIVGN